jgi:choline dehydrogenase-like flavoprotein
MESQVFEYIVVGAGSAGSFLANRLSADPKNRVLVLEAGRESHPWSRIPVGFAKLIQNPAANWLYSSEPDDGTDQRRIPIPRGKLLGGSSSINGMVFVRGQAQDYDTWAQLGNRGSISKAAWPSWRACLPPASAIATGSRCKPSLSRRAVSCVAQAFSTCSMRLSATVPIWWVASIRWRSTVIPKGN